MISTPGDGGQRPSSGVNPPFSSGSLLLRYLLFEIRILYSLLFEHLLLKPDVAPDDCRPERDEIHEKGTGLGAMELECWVGTNDGVRIGRPVNAAIPPDR